jgi:hypothetical protein
MKKRIIIICAIGLGNALFHARLCAQDNKIDPAGNVGIGTLSPNYPLEIVKNIDGAAFVSMANNTSGNDAYAGYRLVSHNQSILLSALSDGFARSYPGYHRGAVQLQARAYNGLNIISNKGAGTAGSNTGVIRFITTDGDISNNGDGSDAITRMLITATGKIGIGTIAPKTTLDLIGSYSLNRPAVMTAGGNTLGGTINMTAPNFSSVNSGYISFSFPSDTVFKIGTDYDGNVGGANFRAIAFGRANGSGGPDYMTIKDGGNIGIGTGMPTEKLSVEGNVFASGNISAYGQIKTKKIVVTQTAWPDYVFDKTYKLRSLSSLENFIAQNNHLPELPPAREVEEKGINLGDNQALLLKKIEELTLYVIAMNKKQTILESDNAEMKKKIQDLQKKIRPAVKP